MARRVHALVAACGAVSGLLCSLPAHADVPAGYAGTPFGGTPWPIPGRVDFENFDEGGQGVGWLVDDHTGNFGEGGCAGNAHREGTHPQICLTNNGNEVDTYTAGPMTGTPYPSAEMPNSMYIGYTHAVDWVRLTVNVREAGTYRLSSTWASEAGGADAIRVQVSMNDVVKTDTLLEGTGGYHNWVVYDDFAEIQLDAGVQVLQFNARSQHLNYDYLQLSLVLPSGGVDDGSGGAGGSSGEGGEGGTGGDGAGGTGGSVEAGGTDAGGTASGGESAGGSGGDEAEAGASSGGTPGGEAGSSASAGSSGDDGGDDDSDGGGCSMGQASAPRELWSLALLAGAAALVRRRRA